MKLRFKILLCVLCIMLLMLLLYYIVMVIPTNIIYKEVKQAVTLETTIQNNESPLWRYSKPDNLVMWPYTAANSVKHFTWRTFVWHNGRDGYMRVRYVHHFFDEHGEEFFYAGGLVQVYFKKVDGIWTITSVFEDI